jgi:methylglyoxal synthase
MLIRTCDEHNVTFATNEATKQLLLNDLAVD